MANNPHQQKPKVTHSLHTPNGLNMLCPAEIFWNAREFSTLIPDKYSAELMSHLGAILTAQTHAQIQEKQRRQALVANGHTRGRGRGRPRKRPLAGGLTTNPPAKKRKRRGKPGDDDSDFEMDLGVPQTHVPRSAPSRRSSRAASAAASSAINENYRMANGNAGAAQGTTTNGAGVAVTPAAVVQQPQPLQPLPQQPVPAPTELTRFQWVQCTKCDKWRRVPTTVDESAFEGDWQCSQNEWDPFRANCDVPEENYDATEEQTLEVTTNENEEYLVRKNEFYEKLLSFHRENSQVANLFIEDIKIDEKVLDLFQLYSEVTRRGGYVSVRTNGLWTDVFPYLDCYSQTIEDKTVFDILDNQYERMLKPYEDAHPEDIAAHRSTSALATVGISG